MRKFTVSPTLLFYLMSLKVDIFNITAQSPWGQWVNPWTFSISQAICTRYTLCNILLLFGTNQSFNLLQDFSDGNFYYSYRQISNISAQNKKNKCFSTRLSVVLMKFSQVLSQEWRCSWSSADRRCSKYSWVINNCIAYCGATYIRCLTETVSKENLKGMGNWSHGSISIHDSLSTTVMIKANIR